MSVKLSSLLPKSIQTPRLTLELYDRSQTHVECYLTARNNSVTYQNVGDPGCYDKEELERRHGAVFLSPEEFSKAVEVDTFILYIIGLNFSNDDSDLAPEEDRSARIGFLHVHQHPNSPPEIGYKLIAQFMGKGYATETVDVIVQLARFTLGLRRITLTVSATNTASRRVAEKAGFVLVGERKDKQDGVALDCYSFPMNKA